MGKISLNVNDSVLAAFDRLWQSEGWESRQEAVIFLLQQALARGYVSREKSEIVKTIGGEKS